MFERFKRLSLAYNLYPTGCLLIGAVKFTEQIGVANCQDTALVTTQLLARLALKFKPGDRLLNILYQLINPVLG
jgi:hypothetical protein